MSHPARFEGVVRAWKNVPWVQELSHISGLTRPGPLGLLLTTVFTNVNAEAQVLTAQL
jgi:hypothetical protein